MKKKHGTASKLESGQLAELASAIVRQLPHIEGLGEVAQEWIENGAALRKALRKALVPSESEKKGSGPATDTLRLQVNYDLCVEAAIREGQYDWVNLDVNDKHFKTSRIGQKEVETKFYHFNRLISSEQAIEEMRKDGYHPAELHEGLALRAKHRDLQRQFPIVLLGSIWQNWDGDCRSVVCLVEGSGSGCRLLLSRFSSNWSEDYRFLAVRES